MPSASLAPSSLTSSSGFGSGDYASFVSDDTNWAVASDNNTNTSASLNFVPPGTMSGTITITIKARRTAGSGSQDPTLSAEVQQNTVPVATLPATAITSNTSQTLTLIFDASALTDPAAAFDVIIDGSKTGGSPSKRSAVDMGYVKADITYSTGPTRKPPRTSCWL